ncbi:hypothetical protein T265_07920 [Opisthorchis viverrini]|uniref:Uncharacterized protein n=1 Tax=Opisthorchis viverrini TaxID=6198 RepID=A0A074ZFJ1_OPIVI|nr:hypothetical protein T265_07920 [Opisthorchis viverrini]KER24407.1 hypothetical protein T265_07920 [Opisthorchis viverrini]
MGYEYAARQSRRVDVLKCEAVLGFTLPRRQWVKWNEWNKQDVNLGHPEEEFDPTLLAELFDGTRLATAELYFNPTRCWLARDRSVEEAARAISSGQVAHLWTKNNGCDRSLYELSMDIVNMCRAYQRRAVTMKCIPHILLGC